MGKCAGQAPRAPNFRRPKRLVRDLIAPINDNCFERRSRNCEGRSGCEGRHGPSPAAIGQEYRLIQLRHCYRRASSEPVRIPHNRLKVRRNWGLRVDPMSSDLRGVRKCKQLRRGDGRNQTDRKNRINCLPGPVQAATSSFATAASRFFTIASKNCSVVIHGWSGPTRIARSLVI